MGISDNRKSATGEEKQFISFTVGAGHYGLELMRVKEVIRMRHLTWLPKAPSCVKGVINLRGDVVPIVDLRDRFGLEPVEQTAMTRVIVLDVEERSVGVVVDSASQVMRLPEDQFDLPPQIMGEVARDFINSVGKVGESLVIMIDTDRILSTEEMRHIAGSLAAAAKEEEPALRGA